MRERERDTNKSPGIRDRPLRFGTTMQYAIPYKVMKARGWRETEGDDWDFFFADVGWIHDNIPYASPGSAGVRLQDHQRVNHFPNHVELTRKDLMAKNLKRARKALEKDGRHAEAKAFDFFPQTFVLPSEHAMFVRTFKDKGGGLWIMKPIGRAQGTGIFLVNRLKQVEQWLKDRQQGQAKEQERRDTCSETYIAQEYISHPYLIGGRKFDLRIYALVISFAPLKAYLYRDGFARFTSTRYSVDKASLDRADVHLTNHAVQKLGTTYDSSQTDLKWPLQSLKKYLVSVHGMERANECFGNIQRIVINSLRAVQPVLINDKHCYELYGYDVMIDSSLKPWLVEVNASPSLTSDSADDYELKFGLTEDMFCAMDLEGYFAGDSPRTVGGFDLIVDNNNIVHPGHPTEIPTMLGCASKRKSQLRHLYARYAQGEQGGSRLLS